MNWFKQNKWKVIAPVLILAVLAFAFWYGSDSPNARGWTVEQPTAAPETQPATAPGAVPTQPETVAETTAEIQAAEDRAVSAVSALIDSIGEDDEAMIKAARAAFDALNEEQQALVLNRQDLIDAENRLEEQKKAQKKAARPTAPRATEPEEEDDWEEETEAETEGTHVCYVSITCDTIFSNWDLCDPDKVDFVPADGVILWEAELEFEPGESVFDVLQRACWDYGIHMESEWTPMYNSAYIEGIGNIYEFDVGEDSGWMYSVNGWFPNYGSSRYELEDYDYIQWVYTCDLGNDVGGSNALG